MSAQFLDNMDLERERGITIKARSVRLAYHAQRRPGLRAQPDRHARATSTSTTRCRAASPPARARSSSSTPRRASQAQTLANVYLALDNNLAIVPVLNKIDLPAADPDGSRQRDRGHDRPRRRRARSWRSRQGGHRAPRRSSRRSSRASRRRRAMPDAPLRALIFDCWFDPYHGVVVARARHRRHAVEGRRRIRLDGGRQGVPGDARRACSRRAPSRWRASGRARSASSSAAIKEIADTQDRRHGHRRRPAGRRAAARLQAGQADGVRGPLSRRLRRVRGAARRAREAPPERRVVHLRARDARRRSASASAAASSACSTWRSSRSGSSASST